MQEIETDDAPITPYPYSQAIREGDTIYVSGQVGVDEDGEIVDGVREQAELTLDHLEAILEAAGASLDDVVKTTVYLTDADDFDAFNEVYGERLNEPYPARSAVVTDLVVDAAVEVDVVAEL